MVIADDGCVWNTDRIDTDEEWIAFAQYLRGMIPAQTAVLASAYTQPAVAPVFFDPHVCRLPSTADLIGREMDSECSCGRRWRLEHYLIEGELLGPSWILALRRVCRDFP